MFGREKLQREVEDLQAQLRVLEATRRVNRHHAIGFLKVEDALARQDNYPSITDAELLRDIRGIISVRRNLINTVRSFESVEPLTPEGTVR